MANTNVNPEIEKISDKYASVMADIYSRHYISATEDPMGNVKGIRKAMAEFAVFYKNNSY